MVRRVMEKRRHRPLFLIDIAVPRNIESEIHSLDDVYLYNIDDLEEVAQANLRLRRKEIQQAESYIHHAVDEFLAWTENLEAAPTIQLLQSYFDQVLEEEIQRLGPLTEVEKERFLEFAHRLRSKFLHGPLETLKESSHTGTLRRTLEAIHTLFRLHSDEIRIPDRDTRQ
jgi:glutamyl-tRNA reductase